MFNFERNEDGSTERYGERIEQFVNADMRAPWVRHLAWWLLHNCIAHPMIGALPFKPLFKFHDWTSRKMNPKPSLRAYREDALIQAALAWSADRSPARLRAMMDAAFEFGAAARK